MWPPPRAPLLPVTLIEPARIAAVDPYDWLADTLARIPDDKTNEVDDLFPSRRNG
ncbi:transposase domain-containing protein [Paenirhodobacter populi]|uniref:transposase domain-containing protein n=1 Tax=Paenirhodobacter populi TaxID=2306993 RepID=UPI0013E2D282|nr:transposase domain-containing protein [Sinirhodobacter populi]